MRKNWQNNTYEVHQRNRIHNSGFGPNVTGIVDEKKRIPNKPGGSGVGGRLFDF